MATKLTQSKDAISAERSFEIGMIDKVLGKNVNEFQDQVHSAVLGYLHSNKDNILMNKKVELTDSKIEQIEQHRSGELAIMRQNFQSKEYKDARERFVMKKKALVSPSHLTKRRGQVMSGKKLSKHIMKSLGKKIDSYPGRKPKLAVLLVGDRPDSKVYVDNILAKAETVGMEAELIWFKERLEGVNLENELIETIERLNNDDSVDGIMLKVPTLLGVDANTIIPNISVDKDVDCLNPENFHGCLNANESHYKTCFVPPCPAGILELIVSHGVNLKGKNAVVVGSSTNLGWPVACL